MIWRYGLGRRTLGQLDWLPSLVSAGLQAGGAIYGAQMQMNIAKMQKQTQEDIQNKQTQAAQAAAQAQTQAAQIQAQTQVQTAKLQAANPTILGINRDVFVVGGVGAAILLGVIAIVTLKSSQTQLPTAAPQVKVAKGRA